MIDEILNSPEPATLTVGKKILTLGGKKRIHILAVGSVGSTLLTALKILGGNEISTLGIYDLNENVLNRWEMEMGQISQPQDYFSLPEVKILSEEKLFDCDVFIFAATKFIPEVAAQIKDVRMAQYAANRPLAEFYGKKARDAQFKGLFVVLSDPIEPLCKVVWKSSGLLPEQVQGFGLGVMNARAAYIAKREKKFADFLTQGRSFGAHGEGLVIANSIENYFDELSRELTAKVQTANLVIRQYGFKPFIAPAISSGAFQILSTLRGQWHLSSVPLDSIWFGVKNRFTDRGLEIETLPLHKELARRIRESQILLESIK